MQIVEVAENAVYVQHTHKHVRPLSKPLYDTIDWLALARQKTDLVERIVGERGGQPEHVLEGLVSLIDAIQDDAEAQGYPVVWAYDPEDWNSGAIDLEEDYE